MHLELFKDKKDKYRIRLRASNGKIIMSSEAYASRRNAMDTANSIWKETCLTTIDKTR
jgi:uncharacterized protein YegP (UPF0339 family)